MWLMMLIFEIFWSFAIHIALHTYIDAYLNLGAQANQLFTNLFLRKEADEFDEEFFLVKQEGIMKWSE